MGIIGQSGRGRHALASTRLRRKLLSLSHRALREHDTSSHHDSAPSVLIPNLYLFSLSLPCFLSGLYVFSSFFFSAKYVPSSLMPHTFPAVSPL